jgi:hypothetical protein
LFVVVVVAVVVSFMVIMTTGKIDGVKIKEKETGFHPI